VRRVPEPDARPAEPPWRPQQLVPQLRERSHDLASERVPAVVPRERHLAEVDPAVLARPLVDRPAFAAEPRPASRRMG
jgi:hypothetical protein